MSINFCRVFFTVNPGRQITPHRILKVDQIDSRPTFFAKFILMDFENRFSQKFFLTWRSFLTGGGSIMSDTKTSSMRYALYGKRLMLEQIEIADKIRRAIESKVVGYSSGRLAFAYNSATGEIHYHGSSVASASSAVSNLRNNLPKMTSGRSIQSAHDFNLLSFEAGNSKLLGDFNDALRNNDVREFARSLVMEPKASNDGEPEKVETDIILANSVSGQVRVLKLRQERDAFIVHLMQYSQTVIDALSSVDRPEESESPSDGYVSYKIARSIFNAEVLKFENEGFFKVGGKEFDTRAAPMALVQFSSLLFQKFDRARRAMADLNGALSVMKSPDIAPGRKAHAAIDDRVIPFKTASAKNALANPPTAKARLALVVNNDRPQRGEAEPALLRSAWLWNGQNVKKLWLEQTTRGFEVTIQETLLSRAYFKSFGSDEKWIAENEFSSRLSAEITRGAIICAGSEYGGHEDRLDEETAKTIEKYIDYLASLDFRDQDWTAEGFAPVGVNPDKSRDEHAPSI